MLGKLLKHEMKATARLLLPIFLVLAALTVLDRIVISLKIFKGVLAIIPGFISFFYVISLVAIVVVTAVIIIYRFYKNLMTDEGYLMFTLPAKPHELINAKLIASIVWTIASFVAVLASLFVIFYDSELVPVIRDMFGIMIDSMRMQFGSKIPLFVIEMILMFILTLLNNILSIYVSVAIGQLFNGHKLLGSFAAYIGINTVIQIVTTVFALFSNLIFKNSVAELDFLIKVIFPFVIVLTLVLNIAYYWGTNFIFKKKLNLD